ncbi:MAG: hypothetical protein AB7S26_17590 [Sandaracinaceae bacterium]
MQSLTGIRSALLEELEGDVGRLHFINTRLILTVGVNLNQITPALDQDARKVQSALDSLKKMGFLLRSSGPRSGGTSHG